MMATENEVLKTMDMAIEKIRPYLPENYEVDDTQWCDSGFQFSVFDCTTMESSMRAVDTFRFFKNSSLPDADNEERLYDKIQQFIDGWK